MTTRSWSGSAFTPCGSTASIAATAASASATLSAPQVFASQMMVTNAGSTAAYMRWGAGSQTAQITDTPILPGSCQVLSKGAADTVAAITGAGTTTLYVSPGEGYSPRKILLNTAPPGVVLDLMFAGSTTLDGRITFTRASTATYFDATGTMQTAASGAPRFDNDPVSHQARGLLMEEARTNQSLNSGDFSAASWNKINCTLSAAVAAPDGSTTARGLIGNSGQLGWVQVANTPAAGSAITISVFAKAGSATQTQIIMPTAWWADATNRACMYNLIGNGSTASLVGGTASASITYVGNGWYRCVLTATPDTSASGAYLPWRTTTNGDGVTTQIYGWGAQFEVGAFPTSYIPTSGATATRAADSAILTDAVTLGGSSTRSLALEAEGEGWTGSEWLAVADDGTLANRIGVLDTASSDNIINLIVVASVVVVNGNGHSVSAWPSRFKSAIASTATTTYNYANNGVGAANTGTGTTGTMPALSRIQIGVGGTNVGSAWFRRIRFWNRTLTVAECQQVTT